MTERSPISARTAATIQRWERRGDRATAMVDFVDTYTAWKVNRSSDWGDSTDLETTGLVESGVGRLEGQGAGGPRGGEMVIHMESPYRFSTWAFDPDSLDIDPSPSLIEARQMLVLNATRRFRIDDVKRDGSNALLMTLYVTELFVTPLPEGA